MIKKFSLGFLQAFPDIKYKKSLVRNLFRGHPSRTLTKDNKFFSNEATLIAPDILSWWEDE